MVKVAPPEMPMAGLAERIRVSSEQRRRLTELIRGLRTAYEAAPRHRAESNPLEALVAAVSAQAMEAGAGALDRRLRVADVGPPHRPTKRSYDYFGELKAAVAANEVEQRLRRGS